jgi:hypothetical protein
MASSTRSEREEERRLNMRTLVIASGASALAAAVTSQLWIHGTWLAAALTPVLVALISEALHRPTERLARTWPRDRAAPPPAHESRPPPAERTLPASGAAAQASGAGPVRVYRQPAPGAPRRRLAFGVVAATAAIAFVVAVVVVTAGDLISGGSIGKGGGPTTFFSPNSKKQSEPKDTTPQQTTTEQPSTTEQPAPTTETAPEEPRSDTAPATPPPEAPPGEPVPNAPSP